MVRTWLMMCAPAFAAGALVFPAPLAADPGAAPARDEALPKGALVHLGSWRLRHLDSVRFLAFGKDEGSLISGSIDGTIRVWDTASGARKAEHAPGEGAYTDGDVLPDGRVIFARGSGTLDAWRPGDAKSQQLAAVAGTRIAVSPDGKHACVTGQDERARLAELGGSTEVREIALGTFGAGAAAFSPNGKHVVVASNNRNKILRRRGSESEPSAELHVIAVDSGEITLAIDSTSRLVHDVAYTPDGAEIVAVDERGGVRTWRVADGSPRFTWDAETPSEASSLALTPDGKVVAVARADGAITLVSLAGEEVRTLQGRVPVGPVAFSRDGSALAAGVATEVRVWSYPDLVERVPIERHSGPVSSVAWSPDGAGVITGGYDRSARVWDAASGEQRLELDANPGFVNGVVFGADFVAAAGQDGHARTWSEDGKALLDVVNHDAAATALGSSPDGKLLATAGADGSLVIFDAASGEARQRVDAIPGLELRLAWTSDGARIAVGAADVRILNVADGAALRVIPRLGAPVTALAWSPDGRTLAVGLADRSIRLYEEGQEGFRTLHGHAGRLTAVAYSPDGSRLASASSGEKGIRLWDPKTGDKIASFDGYEREVLALAYSPDGKRLAGASMDASVLIWDVAAVDAAAPVAPVTDEKDEDSSK